MFSIRLAIWFTLDIVAEQQRRLEIDEKGLKKYLDFVIREVKKGDKNNP
jgi:hypothetical protein